MFAAAWDRQVYSDVYGVFSSRTRNATLLRPISSAELNEAWAVRQYVCRYNIPDQQFVIVAAIKTPLLPVQLSVVLASYGDDDA